MIEPIPNTLQNEASTVTEENLIPAFSVVQIPQEVTWYTTTIPPIRKHIHGYKTTGEMEIQRLVCQ